MSKGWATITFQSIIWKYSQLQSKVLKQVQSLASTISGASPGKFLLVQFAMSQVTQIGESLSNLISQVNTVISMAVRNQKGS
jgi:hypothetical protein